MIDLRHLTSFITVLESGGFTKAAARIGSTQASLSTTVAELEDTLQAKLLTRGGRQVTPTEAGTSFYHHARQLIRLMDDTRNVVLSGREGVAGAVRLGLPMSFGALIGPPLVARCREIHPDLELQLDEQTVGYGAAHLINARLDLCVLLTDDMLSEDVDSTPLLQERFWFLRKIGDGPTPLPHEVPLETVAQHRLILATRTTAFRAVIARQFAQLGLKPEVSVECNTGPTTLDLILGGHGASLLPYSEFALDPRLPAIERALVAPAFSRYATLAQSRLQPLSPAAAAVRALMFEIAGELIHSGEWQGAEMRGGDV